MPRTGIPGGRTGHDGLPSRLQMVITRGPGVRSAVPAPARLLVVVAAVALGRPRHPRPGQARSGASPPIRRLGLSAGARPPRRPPGGVGLAGMAWGMRRAVPGFKHGAFRAGWPSCPKLARPAPAHAPRPARPECPFPGASPTGPSLAPAGQFTLCRPGKWIGPDPRLYPKGISAPARQAWARARTLPGLFDKLWGRPAHCRTPPLFPVRCMVFPKNCPLTSTYVRYIIIVHQFEFEGRPPRWNCWIS